jgi:hypothetical protein
MGHGTGYGPFFRRAMVEQRMGPQADWSVVDALMLKTLAAAEKVARYRHAQLSPVRLAGDINAKVDIGELLESIKSEWTKLGATHRPGSGAGAAGAENLEQLEREESNNRARLASRGLSPARPPLSFPAHVAPAAARWRVSGAEGLWAVRRPWRMGGALGEARAAAGSAGLGPDCPLPANAFRVRVEVGDAPERSNDSHG